jgi:hypothetical protein
MKKIFGAVLLSVPVCAVFPSRGEMAHAADGTAAADPVQHCLDLLQLNLARKIAPALHLTSRPVQSPAKNLPTQCLAGNIEEIKNALKNQIANCQG